MSIICSLFWHRPNKIFDKMELTFALNEEIQFKTSMCERCGVLFISEINSKYQIMGFKSPFKR